jgi:hypothetical protein
MQQLLELTAVEIQLDFHHKKLYAQPSHARKKCATNLANLQRVTVNKCPESLTYIGC